MDSPAPSVGSSATRKDRKQNNLRAIHWDAVKGRDDWSFDELATIGAYLGDAKHPVLTLEKARSLAKSVNGTCTGIQRAHDRSVYRQQLLEEKEPLPCGADHCLACLNHQGISICRNCKKHRKLKQSKACQQCIQKEDEDARNGSAESSLPPPDLSQGHPSKESLKKARNLVHRASTLLAEASQTIGAAADIRMQVYLPASEEGGTRHTIEMYAWGADAREAFQRSGYTMFSDGQVLIDGRVTFGSHEEMATQASRATEALRLKDKQKKLHTGTEILPMHVDQWLQDASHFFLRANYLAFAMRYYTDARTMTSRVSKAKERGRGPHARRRVSSNVPVSHLDGLHNDAVLPLPSASGGMPQGSMMQQAQHGGAGASNVVMVQQHHHPYLASSYHHQLQGMPVSYAHTHPPHMHPGLQHSMMSTDGASSNGTMLHMHPHAPPQQHLPQAQAQAQAQAQLQQQQQQGHPQQAQPPPQQGQPAQPGQHMHGQPMQHPHPYPHQMPPHSMQHGMPLSMPKRDDIHNVAKHAKRA